jgi:glutamine amidotransferase
LELGLLEPLRELVQRGETPFLGICVGMQVLAAQGTEFAPTRGFGALSGIVERFDFSRQELPLLMPHMGWNEVDPGPESTLFRGMDPGDRTFYFLHSYRLVSNDSEACFSYCKYGERFIAALEKGCVYGVQFHPEKSQRNGHLVIANFLGASGG